MTPRTRLVAAVCGWVVALALLTGVGIASPSVGGDLAGAPYVATSAWFVGLVAITAQAAVLARAPWHPAAVLVVVAAAVPLSAASLGPAVGCTSVAVLLAAFRATLHLATPRTWVALAAAVALVAAGQLVVLLDDGTAPAAAVLGSVVQGLGTVGLAALAGFLVATRRESSRARDDRDLAQAREQAALIEVAVAQERTAMARELHDIAAHHLTGIAVMTGAISKQIDRDPASAKLAVEQVRQQSREMLRDMRGLVGLLRPTLEADPDGGTVRQQSFDGIQELVADARANGAVVELTCLEPQASDPRDRVGPLAQLSAYRTVQEALSNAARHAQGRPVRVQLDVRSPDEVRITVSNEMPPPDPASSSAPTRAGFGLVGMRERAELTNSRLEHGPQQGHWVVRLVVPAPDERPPTGGREPEDQG